MAYTGQTTTDYYAEHTTDAATGEVKGKYGGVASSEPDVACGGEITVKLQWHGPDPAPEQVLLEESCVIDAYGAEYVDCDNGLGDSTVFVNGTSAFAGYGNTTQGVYKHYTKTSGSVITLKREPYAVGGGDPEWNNHVSLVYSINVIPLRAEWLALTEISKDDDNLDATVVGKRVKASLAVPSSSHIAVQGPVTPSVSGEPLSEFRVSPARSPGTPASADPDTLKGEVFTFSSPQALTTQSKWHWWKPGDKEVTATFPASYKGKNIGPITLTRPVKIYTPASRLIATVSRPLAEYSRDSDLSPEDKVHSRNIAVFSNPIDSLTFRGQVNDIDKGFTGGGGWAFVQLRNAAINRISGSLQRPYGTGGTFQLDTTWPYAPFQPLILTVPDSYGNPPMHPMNVEARTADSPDVPLRIVGPPTTAYPDGRRVATSYTVLDKFQMYIMYRPSGSESQWVPLKRVTWQWSAAADRGDESNPWPKFPPVNGVVPKTVPGSEVKEDSGGPFAPPPNWVPPYPTWDYIFGQSQTTQQP